MRPRIRAFLIHLTASTALGLLTLGLVFGLWYPPPLQIAAGVTSIYLLLLGVDVFIGPVLTFVVYKVGKKSLRLDLAIIICLQLVAFSYGLWTVAAGRPAWVVFNVDRFDLIQAYQLDERNQDTVQVRYREPSWFGPEWVAAIIPTNPKEHDATVFEVVSSGVDIALRPELYQPLADVTDEIKKRAHPLNELNRYNSTEAVENAKSKWPAADSFLPMKTKVRPMTVLIRKDSAQIVAIVDLNPWK